jgi:hypothetical protein
MKKAKEYAQEIINTYIEQNQDAALVKAAPDSKGFIYPNLLKIL